MIHDVARTKRRTSSKLVVVLFLMGAWPPVSGSPPQSTHGVLEAVPAPKEGVAIDGVLASNEWRHAGLMLVYSSAQLRHRYSVEVSAMWDPEALYLGMHFLDPTPLINNVDALGAPFDGW